MRNQVYYNIIYYPYIIILLLFKSGRNHEIPEKRRKNTKGRWKYALITPDPVAIHIIPRKSVGNEVIPECWRNAKVSSK